MRNHTLRTFQGLTQRMAQVMGRRDRVSVSFGGTIASAALIDKGRYHVNLPALPAGTVMSEHEYRVYNGYIDHESAHLRWSDFEYLKVKQKDPILKHMVNLVEDIRIENKQIDTYPGSRKFLDALCYHVDKEGDNDEVRTQAEQILSLIYKEAYAKYRDIDTNVVPEWLGDFKEYKAIEDYMAAEMPKLVTNQDTKRIAQGIKDRLPKNVDWSQPKSEPGKGQGEGGKPQLVMIGANGESLEEIKEEIKAALEELEQAALDNDQHEERKKVLKGLLDQIEDSNLKSQAKVDLPEQGPVLPPCGIHHDRVFVPSHEDMHSYETTRRNCSPEITAAKKMLSMYLRSRKNVAWSRGLEEGELDTHQLHELVALGSNKVMKERRSRDFMNTAVLLMVDNSGSMNSRTTKTAAIILAEALNSIKFLKLEVTGFTTNGHSYDQLRDAGRCVGIDIMLYKGFDEPYAKAKGRLGAIQCTGYTPLGEAYGHGFERLMARKEARRVLWIISDGEPCLDLANNRHSEYELMRRTHAKCRRLGVETVGTYVGHSSRAKLKKYVDTYSCIRRISDMPQAMLEIVKGITK